MHRVLDISPVGLEWLVVFDDGNAFVLDGRQERLRFSVPREGGGEIAVQAVAADPTLTLIAVSHATGLKVYGDELLWEVEHEPWETWERGSCLVDRERRVWCVRRDTDYEDRVVVLDASTGEVLASGAIDRCGCMYRLVLHPDGPEVAVDGGAGQDGAFIWRAALSRDGLTIVDFGASDRIMGAFIPDGSRFVTAPHQQDAVMVHEWPSGAALGRLDAEDIFLSGGEIEAAAIDSFDYRAGRLAKLN